MKHLRSVCSLAMVLILALALSTSAFAASITIDPNLPEQGQSSGETYQAYKIFDASFQDDDTSGNVSYTIRSTSPFFTVIQSFTVRQGEGAEAKDVPVFTLTQVNNTDTYIVTKSVDYDAADLASVLKEVITDTTPVKSVSTPNQDGKYELTGLDKGYYLILSSLGSKMIVDTLGAVEIDTKNDYPTLSKKIVTTAADAEKGIAEVLADTTTADRGGTITFKISVTIPETAVGEITVHDALDDDMTFGSMTEITGITKQEASEETNPCSFEFVLSANYVEAHKGTTVAIYYTATLNGDAETATAHPNGAYLTYAAYTSVTSTVNVYTYQVDVFKYTSNADGVRTGLAGAGFVLKNSDGKYYKESQGTVMWVDSVSNATEYRTADAVGTQGEEGYVPARYTVVFTGLANGTYTLVENTVPTGYNPAMDTEVVVENANRTGDSQIKVLNQTGAELPATGGAGTTIFYTVGGILMAGAAILLITKKRMSIEA